MWREWETIERHTGHEWDDRRVRDRGLGRNKAGEDCIKRNLEVIGMNGHIWSELARNRDQWRGYVDSMRGRG